MKTICAIALAGGLVLMTGCAGTGNQGAAMDTTETPRSGSAASVALLADVPAAVKETVREKAPNGEVVGVVKTERNGQTVYEVVFADPIRFPKLWIADDGRFLSNKEKY